MKTCSKCKETKSLEEFHKNGSAKNGHANKCKKCVNDRAAKWRNENRDIKRERDRDYCRRNKELIKMRLEQRKESNPVIHRAYKLRASLRNARRAKVLGDYDFFTPKYLRKWLRTQRCCKYCGKEFNMSFVHHHPLIPSLDRFDPAKGYVKENVYLVCWRCNKLKRNADPRELRRLADGVCRVDSERRGIDKMTVPNIYPYLVLKSRKEIKK